MCRLFTQAQKICYKSSSVRFKQLEDLVHPLKHLYPNLPLTSSTYLCQYCYNRALKLVSSPDYEFITDNEVTDNVVDRDEDFLPSTSECIEEFNNEISTSFLGSVSPLKRKNVYGVSITANESTVCHCTEFIQNLGLALQKCSTVLEKIKILTLLPSSLTKNAISSLFPDITMYMIERAKILHKKREFIPNQKHTQAIQLMKGPKKLLWNII